MKIQRIQVPSIANNKQNKTPTSFKGGADGLMMFWDAIGRGGWTAQFILQDVCGNNLPRTTISLNRNKKELGHLNYMAAAETFLRESLSGPSMVAIPLGVMALATKLTGQATKVSTRNIADFSEIMKETLKNFGKNAQVGKNDLKQAFYENVLNAVDKNSLDGQSKDFVDSTLAEIYKIEGNGYAKRGFLKKLLDKPLIKDGQEVVAQDKAISDLQKNFSRLRQQKVEYGADFLSAKIAPNGKNTAFTDLTNQMKGFFDDFSKNRLKITPETKNIKLPDSIDTLVDRFKNLRTGQRFLTGIIMTGFMMAFLSIVPKIYSISKTNPEDPIKTNKAPNAGGAK